MAVVYPKVSKNFNIAEFVPKAIWDRYGKNSKWFIQDDAVKLAQFIRDWFEAPMTINNWHKGERFSERGYRLPDSKTGGKYSQHKLGGAIDFNIQGLTPNNIRREIVENYKEFMKAGLTTLEHEAYATTWVHADLRRTDLSVLLVVKPVAVSILDNEQDNNEYYKVGQDGLLVPIDFS